MSDFVFQPEVARRLRSRQKVCAAWAQMGCSISAEIFAEAGFDMLVIDAEHSPTTLPGIVSLLQAIKGTGCFPMVRAPWNDPVSIKQLLDCGAAGIHVPYVSTREEAELAVRCCKYPPQGIRGIAGSQRAVGYGAEKADYYARANREVLVMVAIETEEGVRNIREIAAVDGLDGIFIGPADLSASMGYLDNPAAPAVQAAIRTVEQAVLSSDKFLGTVAAGMGDAAAKYDRGYSLLYLLSDTTCLSSAAAASVSEFHRYLDKEPISF
ncbi:5-keto-4-deoxy-D-glucarate aldolase [Oscillospiraceae bacterium]|nr:5-keto-4-deoxy-D-glucarate aldolase [Oscillospiraceae bacterium]BDF76461.1 5-keto-4-deoxy-D-glucarate aldolase [Oscillospiraceae bacterium]